MAIFNPFNYALRNKCSRISFIIDNESWSLASNNLFIIELFIYLYMLDLLMLMF